MAFNLKKVLKALLFSSSQPLSTKDIQETLTRFHASLAAAQAGDAAAGKAPEQGGEAAVPAAVPSAPPAEVAEVPDEGEFDGELYQDVPSLVTAAQIWEAMDEIILEVKASDDVFTIVETAEGYRMVTQPRFARWVRLLRNEPPPLKLSQSAMETLAVVAYRQPVTRAEIEHIRGVSAEAGINRLLERELIEVVGRADLPGRPIQYGTTESFLEFVGVRSLDELPASDVLSHRQIDDWLKQSTDGRQPSDRDMGLADENGSQLSLEQAADPAPGAAVGSLEAPPAS